MRIEKGICMNKGKDMIIVKKDREFTALVAVFAMILFYLCVMTRHTCDYPGHAAGMARIPLRPLLNPSNWISYFSEHGYPLWFMTGHLIMRILNCPQDYAAGIDSGIWHVLSYVGVLELFRYLLGDNVNKRHIAVLTFILFLVAPVWLPWRREHIVLGVGGINVWHNATNICGRAVGIFAFYFSMKLLDIIVDTDYTYKPKVKMCILLSILYVISLLAKPSFAQTFVPAYGLLLLYYLIKSKGKFLRQFLIIAALAVPPILRLLTQLMYYFGTNTAEKGLMVERTGEGILVVLPTFDTIVNQVFNTACVLLFPIVMLVIMILLKQRLDKYHAISWMMYLFGISSVLCLKGAASGEMGWALYMSSFFVFMIGIRDYLKIFWARESPSANATFHHVLLMVSTIALTEQFITGLFYLYELIICRKILF